MISVGTPAFSLQYDYAGLFIAQEEWVHPCRKIDTWELIYVTNGSIHMVQEEAYTASKGELLLLGPDIRHAGTRSSPAGTSFYWVHFTVSDFAALNLARRHLVFPDGYKFAPLFKQLLHVANSPVYPAYAAEMVLGIILAEASVAGTDQNRQTSLLKDCAEWIRINSDRKLTVSQVADQFNYHSDYLCSIFQKITNLSLKQYINAQRIQYIKSLLVTTNYSMKQLAVFLGWDNENQLNHYFKYHEKISPSQYRNLYTSTHLNKR